MRSGFRANLAGYLAAIFGIAAVTAICCLLRSHVNEMTVALAMLLVILFIASRWERWPAVLASALAMLCLNYFFLPPIYTFTIEDPKNWVALTAFLITALTGDRLSAWAKQQAAEAAASRSQARLASAYNRSLLEASLDPLMTVGYDGKINDVNAAAETATGCSRAELIGSLFAGHFVEPDKAARALEKVLRGESVRGYALQLRHRSGHTTNVSYDGSLYRDADGNIIGAVASARPVGTYAGSRLEPDLDRRVLKHLRWFSRFAGIFPVAVGLLSIAGVIFHIGVLKSFFPGRPVIKMNTAVCLSLLGVAVWLLGRNQTSGGRRQRIAHLLGGFVGLVGLLSLLEHIFGWHFGIDQLLFREPPFDVTGGRPGLMTPIAAFNFLLLGLGCILLDRPVSSKGQRHWPAQYMAAAAALLAIVGLFDFILGANVAYTRMAVQTAVTVLVVSLGLLCARSERGLAALLASSAEGGVLTRRLLPAAVIIPIAIGALSWRTWSAGHYSAGSAISFMTTAMITLLASFAIWNGFIANRGDVRRTRAENALQQNETELSEAQRLAQMGSWWWNPKTDSVTWSAGLSKLVGRDVMLPPPTYAEHLAFFTPESAHRLDSAAQAALRTGAPFEIDLELLRTDGTLRSVISRGEAQNIHSRTRNGNAEDVLVRGTLQDITERKQAERELEKSAQEIRDLYNHAPCGYHSLDPDGVIVRINDTELEWLQYTREELIGQPFTSIITPACLKTFAISFPQAKATGLVRDFEYELIRKDGTTFPVLLSATAVTGPAGEFLMSRSTVYDITARKKAENEIRQLALYQEVVAGLGKQALGSDPFGKVLEQAVARAAQVLAADYARVLELQPDGKTLLLRAGTGWKEGVVGRATINAEENTQARFTLLSKVPVILEDLRTETRFKTVPMFGDPPVVSGMSSVIQTGSGPYGVFSVHTRQQRNFTKDEVSFLQSVANVLGIMIERRRVEEALLRSNRAHRALSRCNETLVRAADESTLLDQVCRLIVDQAGYRFCWVGHAEKDEAKSVKPLAKAGFEDGYLATVNVVWADTERGHGPTGTAVRTGQIQIVSNFATDPRLAPWRVEALKRGYASSIAIPLTVDGNTFGSLTIYAGEPNAFSSGEIDLLSELAADLGFGITTLHTRAEHQRAEQEIHTLNAELEQRVARRTAQLQAANQELEQAHERETETGFRIQQTLLLDQPPRDVPGVQVAALTIPSQRIDGDFYAFLRHSEDCLDVIVGDVMGKGIPAALLGAATKTHFLRALSDLVVASRDAVLPEPKEIVMLAHAELARHLMDLDSFVTVIYARLNLTERRLTLVDCGHTGILHWHGQSGRCEMLHGDNLPLGVKPDELYDQVQFAIEPGDRLLLFSDGVTEARSPSGDRFGIDRLQQFAEQHGALDPAALVEALRQSVFAFAEAGHVSDDLTSVAVAIEERVLPLARARIEMDSDLKNLRQARDFVRDFCAGIPEPALSQEQYAELELAVNEAASNIMKHAYRGRSDQQIGLDAEAYSGRVTIRLHHFGDPFDPSSVLPPPFDGSREHGFGAYIIGRSVDEVHYYRDARGRNCVELIKFRTPRKGNGNGNHGTRS